MQEENLFLIELKNAALRTDEVLAVAKLVQPETLQTPAVPYMQVTLRNANPLLIPYEEEEERDAEYEVVLKHLRATT